MNLVELLIAVAAGTMLGSLITARAVVRVYADFHKVVVRRLRHGDVQMAVALLLAGSKEKA